MLFPTTLLPARPVGQDQTVELNGRQVSIGVYGQNTVMGAAAGIPGLTLPAGLTRSGLPVGMELDGPMGSDRVLLGIGLALERSAFARSGRRRLNRRWHSGPLRHAFHA